jgi:hypothetical protein
MLNRLKVLVYQHKITDRDLREKRIKLSFSRWMYFHEMLLPIIIFPFLDYDRNDGISHGGKDLTVFLALYKIRLE